MLQRLLPSLLLMLCLGPFESYAQQSPQCAVAVAAGSTAASKPDIMIRASVRAEEVRFASQPEIEVRLTGCSVLDTVRVTERRNLPEPVQPGVTYRDVFVAVEILGYLDVECLLPALGVAPRGAVPDSVGARGGPGLTRLCPPRATDTVPHPLPRP